MTEDDVVIGLAALANAHRLSVFRMLVAAGDGGLLAGDIATKCGLAPSNLSFHLAHLVRAKLVVSQREGRNIRYFLNVVTTRNILDFLVGDCCGGRPELCMPISKDRQAPAAVCRSRKG